MIIERIFLILFQLVLIANGKTPTGLEKLFNHIFNTEDYVNIVRPTSADSLTHISTELKLLQIDLDEKYQELISTVWLEMVWNDERLSWDPELFDNIKEITLPVEKIWVPDIVLQNGVGQNDYLTEFKYFNPWINHEGLVTWVPEVRLHTKCVIKVTDFPFDTQCCEINFYSWAHTANQMTILQFGNKNMTNITHLAYNTEWLIYDTCALNKTIKTSQDLDWWVTSYVVFIKRESIYHIYTLLMPCSVLSVLSILLFWLPPDSDEKITLGVTILLAFFVNSLVVSNYTPEAASELPVIGIYYTFNIFQVAFALSGSVLVLKLHFRGHKLNRVPGWALKLFLIKSEKLFRERSTSTLLNLYSSKKILPNSLYSSLSIDNQKYYRSNTLFSNHIIHNAKSCLRLDENKNQHQNTGNKNNEQLHKLSKLLKYNFRKYDLEKMKLKNIEELQLEWKELARRLDYIFLVCAFLSIVTAPVILFNKYFIRVIEPVKDRVFCRCDHTFT